jgi:hypothetical protein
MPGFTLRAQLNLDISVEAHWVSQSLKTYYIELYAICGLFFFAAHRLYKKVVKQ